MPRGKRVPLIAVPVTAESPEDAGSGAAAAAAAGADLIELRADAFPDIFKEGAAVRLLEAAGSAAGGIPLLFTLRTEREGGAARYCGAAYREVIERAAGSGLADLIDVEAARDPEGTLLHEIRSSGAVSVLSRHFFDRTPSFRELTDMQTEMERAGGDVVKIACMPGGPGDEVPVLLAAAWAREHISVPSVMISMGEAGRLTRICGEYFGEPFTFGALPGAASAPGQLAVPELRAELAGIHEACGKGFFFLTGFMACGKSVSAAAAARITGFPVIEMDREIELEQGRSVSEIFARDGEARFREIETEFLARLAGRPASIVSCGGGAVLAERNVSLMRALGTVILLKAQPEEILRRLEGEADTRPNIRGRKSAEGIRELLEQREPFYQAAADRVVETDGRSFEEVAGIIARIMRGEVHS